MRMKEFFPISCGLLLGAVLGYVRPAMRLPVGGLLAILLGGLATVITGEFTTSWGYLLVDIPLVAVAAVLGLVAARRLRGASVRG
jgi:hypothetical protein